jgi:HD-like signal output (HDOD) protein
MQHIKGYGRAQFISPLAPDFLAEDDENQTSHCIAGLMVATEWELPELLCEAIRGHHYVISDDQKQPHSVALLQLALHAYARSRSWQDDDWSFQSGRVLQTLGLDADQIDAVLDEALASFEVFH